MSGKAKHIVYWDAAIYIAWLKDELCYKDSLPAIQATADANFESRSIIVTSTITLIEVLDSKLPVGVKRKFDKCFDGYHHKLVEVTPAVAMRAREYRDKFINDEKKLLTPDAIHLATATLEEVHQFHTFDKGKKKGIDEDHKEVKAVSLLSLNKSDRIHKLVICTPTFPPGHKFEVQSQFGHPDFKAAEK